MRLTIIAATGGVGRHLLEQAVAAGHDVRNPARRSRRGAVGLGPHSNAGAGIAAPGTRVIIAAMTAAGVRRIVAISVGAVATMATPGRPNPPKRDPCDGFIMRHLLTRVARAAFGNVDADLALMEDALRDRGLDWTAVRPPRLTGKPLTGKPLTGSYRTAYGHNPRRGLPIPRADVAASYSPSSTSPRSSGEVIAIAS